MRQRRRIELKRHLISVSLLIVVFFGIFVSPISTRSRGSSTRQESDADQTETRLNVMVLDSDNRVVEGLQATDFQVFEDGVAQPITRFSRERAPVRYVLAIDSSGSVRNRLTSIVNAARSIIADNGERDETCIIRFVDSEKIQLKQDFTTSKRRLGIAIDDIYVEGGMTALFDAVDYSLNHLAKAKNVDGARNTRFAIVLITDGEDRSSYITEQKLFDQIGRSEVSIFSIGLTGELSGRPRSKAKDFLAKLARESGGFTFFANNEAEIATAAHAISSILRSQYLLAYAPSESAASKPYRKVEVRVSNSLDGRKLTAITRPGYFTTLK
jgi:Ca-activated chloride channel family protein